MMIELAGRVPRAIRKQLFTAYLRFFPILPVWVRMARVFWLRLPPVF